MVPDPSSFTYPVWPPSWLIDSLQWYGNRFDRLIMARPVWYWTINWIDALFWGPYSAVAIYAFYKGREWIRLPSLLYASSIMTATTITLDAQVTGEYASPQVWVVVIAYSMWYLVPALMIYRMWKEHPFTRQG